VLIGILASGNIAFHLEAHLALARTGVGVVDSFHLLGNRERGLKHLKFTPTTVQTAKIILPRDGRISRPARLLLGAIRESAARLSQDHLRLL
jgi:hypothetical protein